MKYSFAFALVVAVPTCFAQQPTSTTGQAKTNGYCSPAVTGSNNKFTITCQNVPEKLRIQLVDVVERIARNQADAEAVLSKLDSCLVSVKQMREQQEPWRITEDQKRLFKQVLNGIPQGGIKVSINVLPSERNAGLFGGDVGDLLKDIGWSATGTSDFTVSPQVVGVYIVVKRTDIVQATALQLAFRAMGYKADGYVDVKGERIHDDDQVQILIGSKPTQAAN